MYSLTYLPMHQILEVLDMAVSSFAKKYYPELTDQQAKIICRSMRCTLFEVVTNETNQDSSALFRAIRDVLEGKE